MSTGLALSLMLNTAVIGASGVSTFWFGGVKKVPMTFLTVPIKPTTCLVIGGFEILAAIAFAMMLLFAI
jgi:hypothetical protein